MSDKPECTNEQITELKRLHRLKSDLWHGSIWKAFPGLLARLERAERERDQYGKTPMGLLAKTVQDRDQRIAELEAAYALVRLVAAREQQLAAMREDIERECAPEAQTIEMHIVREILDEAGIPKKEVNHDRS